MRLFRLTILGVLVSLVAAGCGGCGREGDPCAVSIRIQSPENERIVFRDEDENPARAGVQVTVEASVASCVTENSSAGLIVNDDANTAREAFVREAVVIFDDVTLVPADAEGHVTLRAWVQDLNTGRTSQDTIVVRVADAPAVDCLFVSPTDGTTLGPDDDVQPERAGLQHDVAIQCAAPLDGTPARLSVDGTPIPSAVFVGDTATFPAVHLSEGINILRGTVTTEAGTWTSQISVTVDTPDCEVRVQPAGAYVFNLEGDPPRIPGREAIADADGDPGTGIQADFTALTPDCFGGQAALFVGGEEVATAPVETGEVDFGRVSLPDGDDVRVYVAVTPAVADGPSGRSVTQSFWVDSVRPSPVVLFPEGGEVLRASADKDGDSSNGIQIDLVVEAPDLESFDDPSVPWRAAIIEAHLTRTDTGDETIYSCLVGIDGCEDAGNPDRYRLELDLDVVADYVLEVVITDPAGNVGREAPIEFSVDARPVAVEITSPEPDAVVNLAFPGVDGTRIPVTVETDAAELEGAEVRVSCSGAATATSTLDGDGAGVVMVDFVSAPCDGRQTACTATVIADGVQYPSPAVEFHLDLVAPELTIVAPEDGAVVFETDVAVEVIAGCLEDGQDVSITDAGGAILGSSAVSGGSAIVTVTLASDEHTLVASAYDAAGNLGTSDAVTFVVSADPPDVVFVTPTDGIILTDDDDVDGDSPGVQYDVVVQVANEPIGTPVTLEIGYDDGGTTIWRAPVATVTTTGTNRRATFQAVSLPEGEFSLRAVATGEFGLRGSATVSPRVSTGVATCNIVSPIHGVSIGPAHDPSATPEAGVRHDVRVRTDLADAAQVVLSHTDAEGGVATLLGTVSDGQAIFEDVVFTTEPGELHGRNLLDAVCVDGAALTTAVDVDLESPEAVILTPEEGAVFNASSLDASAQEGFQIHFRGAASNPGTGERVTAGATATLTVACDGVDDLLYPLTFTTYGDDIEARARPTLEDQSVCVLTFEVTDQAGNVSDPVSVTVRVDRVPPELTIVRPLDGRRFGIVDDQQEFEEGFQQRVEVTYSGVEDGQPVRLFFIRASEDGAEVESSLSPHLVASGSRTGYTFNNATFTLATQDEVIVRVTAEDAAGNVTSRSVTVHIDTEAPQVAITRPLEDAACVNLITDFNKDDPDYVYTQVDVATEGVDDGLPLTLCGTSRDDGGADCSLAGYSVIETRDVANNLALFPAVKLMDGEHEIIAEVRDLAGNFSRSDAVTVCADSVPPVVTSFAVTTDTNSDGYVNAAELDADGGVVCFDVVVEGAEGRTLTVRTNNPADGTNVGQGTVVDDEVTICGALAEGSHALEARVTDENGNPNLRDSNPTIENPEAQRSLIVDTIAPTLSISSPGTLVNAETAGGEDIDADVTFGVTSNAEGRTVTFYVNGTEEGQATVSGGSASIQVTLANNQIHTLRAEVSDAAGNTAERTREVTVDTTPPVVVITEPENGAQLNENSFSMTVDVTGAEVGEPLRVYRTDVTPETLLRDDTVSATQPQSFNVSLPDGEATLVARAWDAAGNVGESGSIAVEIDTVGCSLIWSAPSGSPVVFNVEDDEDSGTGGLQTTLVAETSDCSGLDVELYKNDETDPMATQTSSGTPGQASFTVTLQDGETGSFTARIQDDGFGNMSETTFEFSVDITPPGIVRTYPASDRLAYVAPGNPTIGQTVEGFLRLEDLNDADLANAEVKVTFDVSDAEGGTFRLLLDGDVIHGPVSVTTDPQTLDVDDLLIPHKTDGVLQVRVADAAGNVSTLDLDVKADVVAPAAPTVTLDLVDDRRATLDVSWTAVGDDGTTGTAESIEVRWATTAITGETSYGNANVGAALGGTALETTLTPLPPLNTYWIAVRARDAFDNVSELVTDVNVVSLENMWNEVVLEGDDPDGFFGYVMVPVGVDLNDDGYDDLIVAAPFEAAGGSQRGAVYVYYGGADPENLVRQKFVGVQNSELFGLGAAAGDVTGNGIADLLVGAEGFESNRGRAFLYFGVASGAQLDGSSRIEFRGTPGVTGRFGTPVSVLGDINGNGRNDIAVTARTEGGVGYVYIYFGRTQAEWEALRGTEDFIAASQADLVLAGVESGGAFGFWKGGSSVGALGTDGGESFVIPASSASKAYVFRSSDVLAATESPIFASDAHQVLEGIANQGFDGFMARLDGTTRHLALCDEGASPHRLRIYRVGEEDIEEPPVQVLQRSGGRYCFSTTYGDITGDGLPDVVVGSNSATLTSIFLYFNSGTSPLFSSSANSIVQRSGHLGVSVWVGDVNGDNRRDVAAGASSIGRVFLWW